MSIASEIKRLQNAKADIKSAIENKGVTVGDGTIDTYAEKIGGISNGGTDSYYDTFWDTYQDNGNRTDYEYAFRGIGWKAEAFKPKYNMIVQTATHMFAYNTMAISLPQVCEEQGITIDFSNCTHFNLAFYSSFITDFGTIDTRNANSLSQTFSNCKAKKLHLIVKDDGTTTFPNTFSGSSLLEELTIEGVVGQNISFVNSKVLNAVSVQNIIDHLADLSGDTAQTITFHSAVGGNLTDEQKATITAKNWALAY